MMLKVNCTIAITCVLAGWTAAAQNQPPATSGAANRATMHVRVVSASQMQKEDADLLSNRRAEVARAAEFNGYDLSSGSWIRSQVLCPDAPNHLLMHYLRLVQDGSVSLFTAIVPRGQDQVRIIPVLYHGAQALRVFGSSPTQRDLINQVISTKKLSEGPGPNTDWTALAYCYAALAGAEPNASSLTAQEQTSPRLKLESDGKIQEMSFSVLGPDHLYQDWRIQFDHGGKVKSISLSARTVHGMEAVPGTTSGKKLRPVSPPK